MKRMKIFYDENIHDLQKKVNTWLKDVDQAAGFHRVDISQELTSHQRSTGGDVVFLSLLLDIDSRELDKIEKAGLI